MDQQTFTEEYGLMAQVSRKHGQFKQHYEDKINDTNTTNSSYVL